MRGLHVSAIAGPQLAVIEQRFRRVLAGERFRIESNRRERVRQFGPEWAEISYAPVEIDGRVVGVIIVGIDITDRVEHTRAVEEAYAQLEAVFSASPVALAVWDTDMRLVRANALWQEWTGVQAEHMRGLHLSSIAGAQFPAIEQRFRRVLAGERFTVESSRREYARLSGPAWAEVSYAPVEIDGRVVGVVIASSDITDRVEHTRAIEEAYAQLEAVFDNVNVAIAVYDRDFNVLRLNDEMARWNSVDRAAALGRPAPEVHGPLWPLTEDARRRALSGETGHVEIDRRAAG